VSEDELEPVMSASQTPCPACKAGLFRAKWWRPGGVQMEVTCRTPGCTWNRDTFISGDHPPPWRWKPARIHSYLPSAESTPFPGTLVLYDANDVPVLNGKGHTGSPSDVWATVEFASPLVRALTEAAPEMEALLHVLGDDPARAVTNCHVTYPCSCERHRAQALITRIAKRSKEPT
jgi:hypothetical protein